MKYNKSEIMRAAWSTWRASRKQTDSADWTFSRCLKAAWADAKKAVRAAEMKGKTAMKEEFWTIEFPGCYKPSIQRAAWATKEDHLHLTDEALPITLVSTGEPIELKEIHMVDCPDRPYDGSFLGCGNVSWIISEEEKDAYIALNAQRASERAAAKRSERISFISGLVADLAGKNLPATRGEARKMMKDYNNAHNEGGYGWCPHIYSQEELEEYEAELAELREAARNA